MSKHRYAAAALLSALALVGAACSGPERAVVNEPGERDAQEDIARDARDKGKPGSGKKQRNRAAGRQGIGEDDTASDATREGGENDTGVRVGPGGGETSANGADAAFARGSSIVKEPEPDARKQGIVPGYSEVFEASVVGTGGDLEMTLTFGGDIPQRMPDKDTFMVIGFGMTQPGDKERSWAFGAQATKDGWTPYAGSSDQHQRTSQKQRPEFPGRFVIDGARITMVVPWSYLGGPRELNWQANSGWFRQLANTSHFAFDPIPNKDPAHYPR